MHSRDQCFLEAGDRPYSRTIDLRFSRSAALKARASLDYHVLPECLCTQAYVICHVQENGSSQSLSVSTMELGSTAFPRRDGTVQVVYCDAYLSVQED